MYPECLCPIQNGREETSGCLCWRFFVVESAGITCFRCIILEERLALRHYLARSRRKRLSYSLRATKRSGSESHGRIPLTRSFRPRCVHDALERILADPTVMTKAILWNGKVAGSIGSFLWDGKPQVIYWFGKAFWGSGIA